MSASTRLQASLASIAARTRTSARFQKYLQAQSQKPQFTKVQAYFVKQSFTPAACASCPWYAGNSTCSVVSPVGAPATGLITPNGICGLYWATPARLGAYEKAYGRGTGAKGLFPQTVRYRVEKKRMSLNDPNDIPPELIAAVAG